MGNTTVFAGDEADRWMDRILGLDNVTEIAGRGLVGQEPFAMRPTEGVDVGRAFAMRPTNALEVGQDPFAMLPSSDVDVGARMFPTLPAPGMVSVGEAVRRIAAQAQEERQPVPELTVVPIDQAESGRDELVDVMFGRMPLVFVGQEDPLAPVQDALPLTVSLYREFSAASSDGKIVRLDTEASYRDFRQRGFLKALTPQHDQMRVEEMIEGRPTEGAAPYRPIALQLPPYAEGCVECWQEGDMICCSLRLPGSDGEVRIATAATPVREHVDEVVGYAQRAGLNMVDVLGVLPHLAGMLGGGSLVPKIASAAPSLLSQPEAYTSEVYVGRMQGGPRATSATLIALLQMAQAGDPQAAAEWGALAGVARQPGAEKLAETMRRAQAALPRAQRAA